jgi:hypothetical protein
MECDFCGSPDVVGRFQCTDFESGSKRAGVVYPEYPGLDLVMHSVNYWAVCAVCKGLVEREDVQLLVNHALSSFTHQGMVHPDTASALRQHLHSTYNLFFKHRIRVAAD